MYSKRSLHTFLWLVSLYSWRCSHLVTSKRKKNIFHIKIHQKKRGGGEKGSDDYILMLKLTYFCCEIMFSSSHNFLKWGPIVMFLASKCSEMVRLSKKVKIKYRYFFNLYLILDPETPLIELERAFYDVRALSFS